MAINIDRIRLLSLKFRNAIESCDRLALPIAFADFPRGSCGDSALLLGAFLKDEGAGKFDYICGERGDHRDNTWTSHAWCQNGKLIVDITADQFADFSEPVFVGNPSPWHLGFEVDKPQSSDFREWDSHTVSNLGRCYRAIRKNL